MWSASFYVLGSDYNKKKIIAFSFTLMYSGLQKNWTFWERGKTFPLFQLSFQRISGTNDTSFESSNIGRLEFAKKLGLASF